MPDISPFASIPLIGNGPSWFNGLGVGSYDDGLIDDGGTVDGAAYVQSQKYSIWRVLSRGPVTQSVLNSYLPTKVTQPAVKDIQTSAPAAYQNTNFPAKTILDAHRCVIWVSPYTGDLLTDPGALDDPGEASQTLANGTTTAGRPATTTVLRNFVQGGGRLFITGQDVGSALTLGATSNNGPGGFLSDVMNATVASTGGGTSTLTSTGNRITDQPEYDGNGGGYYPTVTGGLGGQFIVSPGGQPFQSRMEISGVNALGPAFQSAGGLSQRDGPGVPSGANLLGQPDTLNPTNGATTAMTYSNGAVAMVYHDDPFDPTKATPTLPNGGSGGRTVYAGFGLEALGQDAYSSDAPSPAPTLITVIPTVAPRNPRSNLLHNIVCYLRTGFVNGVITQTAGTGAGAGQGVPGVTVYLIPVSGVGPASRPTFSATTSSTGLYSIVGVEPGTYRVAAYKAGFQSTISNAGVSRTVEGDATETFSLTITPFPPGKISGIVHDAAGNLIPGATTTFLSTDKTTTVQGTSTTLPAADGTNYLIQNVPVTSYTGTAIGPNNPNGKPEYQPALTPDPPFDQVVTVTPNTTTTPVNFTLTPILASISGRIFDITNPAKVTPTDQAANGLAGATVTLTQTVAGVTTPISTTKAGAGGVYTLTNIPASNTAVPTTYTITATLAGYSATGDAISVSVYLGDALVNQDIGLTPTPKGGCQRVCQTGRRYAGAWLRCHHHLHRRRRQTQFRPGRRGRQLLNCQCAAVQLHRHRRRAAEPAWTAAGGDTHAGRLHGRRRPAGHDD